MPVRVSSFDATPTASYLRALYKYPQSAFPYDELVAESGRRGRDVPEYELRDTGAFADPRYFAVEAEYARPSADAVAFRIRATTRWRWRATWRASRRPRR